MVDLNWDTVEVWEVRIGTLLAYHGLLQYIISKNPLGGNITDRLKVQMMLVGTIGDSGVLDKMKAAGWNYTDSTSNYDSVFFMIPQVLRFICSSS